MPTIALLGDSILDNRLYVDCEPDTVEHLRRILGPPWTVKLLAVDGSVMADVYRQSAALAPSCDVAVLSVGRNDAIDHLGLLEQTVDSVASVIDELDQIATAPDTSAVRGIDLRLPFGRPLWPGRFLFRAGSLPRR